MNISHSGYFSHVLTDLLCVFVRFFKIQSFYLNVDRGRNSKIQHLSDNVRRLEIERSVWKIVRQRFSDFFNVTDSRFVNFFKGYQNVRVHAGDIVSLDKTQIE